MKYRPYVHLLCLFALLNFCWFQSNAQTPNNCGVTASILPAAHDSVVALYTLVPFTNTSINATSVKWLYDGIPSGITGDLWNYSVSTGVHTISLVAYNGNCSDTTTVVYFCAGTGHNVDSLLVANYGLVDTYENGTCIDNTPDGGFIMGGNGARASCGDKGLMVKLRDRGCIDWSKEITQSIDCSGVNIKAVYASADSNYYVAADNGQSVLIKFDKNGNVAWSTRWGIQNLPNNLPSTTSMGIEKLSGDPAGNIYTVAGSLDWGWVVSKISPAGNIIWNKYYELNYYNPASTDPFDFASPSGIVWLNGALYVAGNAYKNSNKQFFNFLTRMNSTSGKTDWQYGYLNARTDSSTAMNFDHLTVMIVY